MGTNKKSINFIEEADALNELDLNAVAGGLSFTDDKCPYQQCTLCTGSSCNQLGTTGNGPVAS